MRKVVGYLLMTLDGVVEEPGEWLEHFDEDMRENMVEVIHAQDVVLLGCVMYQEWATYWPTATDEPLFADFINNVPKYVVSTTLSSADNILTILIKIVPSIVMNDIFALDGRFCVHCLLASTQNRKNILS